MGRSPFPAFRRRRWRPGATPRTALAGAAIAATAWLAYGGDGDGPSHELTEVRPTPALPPIPPGSDGVTLETYLSAWVPYGERDELLRSSVLRDPEFADRVRWWLGYWTGPAARWFPDFLERMAWLGVGVDSALAAQGMPPSLRYLPLIESGYSPTVTSRAAAVGLWQLVGSTARGLGLQVDSVVDERRHIERSTEAALEYLATLEREFDSWFFTLAAYNAGPTRVRRVLRRHAPDEPRTDSLFWALRHHFAPETGDFLPKLYSAMWIASQPEAWGFEQPPVRHRGYDTVVVPEETRLDDVARAAGVPHEEIVLLNAEFIRGVTPAGRSVRLKVPAGRGDDVSLSYLLTGGEVR